MNLEQMIQRQQELLSMARAAGREFTADEQKEFDSLQREIDAIRARATATEPTQPSQVTAPVQPRAPSIDADAVRAAERQRVTEITSLCREFNVSDDDMRNHIANGSTVDSVRAAILEGMRASKAPVSQGIVVGEDAQDKFRRAAGDALVMRSGIAIETPAEGARELMGMSLRDLAIECLTAEGQSGLNRRSNDELFDLCQRQFYNPTAAFPTILDNAINKAYVEGHKTVAVTFDQWTKKGTLKDFKTTITITLQDQPVSS